MPQSSRCLLRHANSSAEIESAPPPCKNAVVPCTLRIASRASHRSCTLSRCTLRHRASTTLLSCRSVELNSLASMAAEHETKDEPQEDLRASALECALANFLSE